MNKSQLKETNREEIKSLLETKNTFKSFKKDFDNVITHASAYLEGDKIKIYLDTNPNEEKTLQFVHGSEIFTDYEFMPWEKDNEKAVFLRNQWVSLIPVKN